MGFDAHIHTYCQRSPCSGQVSLNSVSVYSFTYDYHIKIRYRPISLKCQSVVCIKAKWGKLVSQIIIQEGI